MFYWLGDVWERKVGLWVRGRGASARLPLVCGRALEACGRRRGTLLGVLLAVLAGCLITLELQTSWAQSRLLAAVGRRLAFRVEGGPAAALPKPAAGPYDRRLGYVGLPVFLERLHKGGYRVAAQARSTRLAHWLSGFGLTPAYQEKNQAGLRILDRSGGLLYAKRNPERIYQSFEEIPTPVVQALLFIENRQVLDERYPYRNPAVEWPRLGRAFLDLTLRSINPDHHLSGGSTLATQLEKVRHSPEGRTGSVGEKARQMASATLRVYWEGEQTLQTRRRIVRDYLNSLPLAALPGHGEVHGLGDGLWAWFGAGFDEVNRLLRSEPRALEDATVAAPHAEAYRQVLSLLLALKKPSTYLIADRPALAARVDSYLRLMADSGLISRELRDRGLQARIRFRDRVPVAEGNSFADRKAVDAVRTGLLALLGLDSVYDLDRLDLTVRTTLDESAQQTASALLQRIHDPGAASAAGLFGERLIQHGDPAGIIYSFNFYERGPGLNLLRVQADNYEQPLSINEGTKLELGSTAKLRTLIHYLEVVAELHARYGAATPVQLRAVPATRPDRLTRWAAEYLAAAQDRSLPSMLEAAMNRRYSASPGEAFFTGGGRHTFSNFDAKDNGRVLTVREAFRRSVNLVFIRLMRDLVHYHMERLPGAAPGILEDEGSPLRRQYLARFADQEGRVFLQRFYAKHAGLSVEESLAGFLNQPRMTPRALAVLWRSVKPEAGLEEFTVFLRRHRGAAALPERTIRQLYEAYGRERFPLNDRGYLARIHPLELWLLEYKAHHPQASLAEVFAASEAERQAVYQWLFKPSRKRGQDLRILTLLEQDAFETIHRAWKRLGYPFPSLVPSYATSIGSSADNPAALAELMGILVNDGIRYPMVRVAEIHLAEGTPLETILAREPEAGQRVLPSEIASLVRRELIGVVEEGTGRRAYQSVRRADGTLLTVGGKTGTGDNRFEKGSGGSKVLNRTASFVFFVDDRYFGTLTAFVPGAAARGYTFTSALPVQVFKNLAPVFASLAEGPEERGASPSE